MNNTELSMEISYALRHAPHEYDLVLDEQGWASIDDLVLALKTRRGFSLISVVNIEDMIQASEKKRYEIDGNRIRALYGHSVKERIVKDPVKPPDVLFHGTAQRFLDSILKAGLLPKKRQYVHLSQDMSTALEVGHRRDSNPVILTIDSKRAWRDGILFYCGNDGIWMADLIPPEYISICPDKLRMESKSAAS